jgi:site-specific recombinase XerD
MMPLINPVTGKNMQELLHQEWFLQLAVKDAVCQAGLVKHVGCHTIRHIFASHLLPKAD